MNDEDYEDEDDLDLEGYQEELDLEEDEEFDSEDDSFDADDAAEAAEAALVGATTNPNDWLFHAQDRSGEDAPFGTPGVWVYFTPVKYWNNEGCCYDQLVEQHIASKLPSYFEEEYCEGMYVTEDGTCLQTVEQDLIARGFKQDSAYSTFVDSHGI